MMTSYKRENYVITPNHLRRTTRSFLAYKSQMRSTT